MAIKKLIFFASLWRVGHRDSSMVHRFTLGHDRARAECIIEFPIIKRTFCLVVVLIYFLRDTLHSVCPLPKTGFILMKTDLPKKEI